MSPANITALTVTIPLAAFYCAGYLVPVPYAPSFNLMTTGLKPAFGAFLAIEILSFILPPLTTLRRQGLSGRKKLNVIAIILALLIAAAQGFAGATVLLADPETQFNLPGDEIYSRAAENTFTLVVMLSLLAGTILATALAHGITRWGVANGLSLLLLGEILWQQVADALGLFAAQGEELVQPEFDLTKLLLLVGALAGAIWFFRKPPVVPAQSTDGFTLELSMPPMPQGIVPLNCMYVAWMMVVLPRTGEWIIRPWNHLLLLLLVGVPILSWAFYHWFSAPDRVSNALAGKSRLDPHANATLVRQAITATGVLIGTPLILATMVSLSARPVVPSGPIAWMLTAASLLAIGGMLLDVFDLWMFRQRAGDSTRVVDFDNVHVASWASALLRSKGIDCCLQGFHHRCLLFHFGAAIKISLHVPATEVQTAREVLRLEELPSV